MNPPAARAPRNFLTRLTDRAAGRERVVEPRVPSLFEPSAPHDVQLADVAEVESGTERAASHVGETQFAAEPHSRRDDPARDARDPPAREARAASPALIAREVQIAGERVPVRAIDASSRADARKEISAHPVQPASTSRRAEAPTPPTAQPAAMQVRRIDQIAQRDAPTSTKPEPARADNALPTRVLAPKRVHVEAPVAAPRRAPEPQHRIDRAPPAEPVVRISIGRVEVRAMQPASAPPSPRGAARRPMSLDEYLEKSRRAR